MVSYLWCHTYGVYVAAKASSLRRPMARHERALTLTHMAPNDSVCVLPVVAFGRTPARVSRLLCYRAALCAGFALRVDHHHSGDNLRRGLRV